MGLQPILVSQVAPEILQRANVPLVVQNLHLKVPTIIGFEHVKGQIEEHIIRVVSKDRPHDRDHVRDENVPLFFGKGITPRACLRKKKALPKPARPQIWMGNFLRIP